MRLQVNNVGRGTDISIHVDTNFKFLLLWIQNTFSKVTGHQKQTKNCKGLFFDFHKNMVQEVKNLRKRVDTTCVSKLILILWFYFV